MRKLLRHLTLICSGVIVLSLLTAPPAQAAVTQVSGTVTGPSGEPVSGSVYFCEVPDTGSCGGNSFTGGAFSLDKPDGVYKIQISAASMDGLARYYVAGQPAGTPDKAAATEVALAGTPVVLDAIQLPAIATLSGTVRNGDGDPMPGVTVLRNRLGTGTQRVTAPDGTYDFGYVLAGSTTVSVHGNGTWAGDRVVLTVPSLGAQVVDLTMRSPAHVSGTLTDAGSGAPIPDLDVLAYQRVGGNHFYVGTASTDSAGRYDVGGLPSGDIVLQYSDPLQGYPNGYHGGAVLIGDAIPIAVTAGGAATHDEALTQNADPRPGRSLSGQVTDGAAGPLVGITVTARSADGTIAGQVDTDRSGRWGLDVGDGDYTLQVASGNWLINHESETPWFPEHYPDSWGTAQAQTITVGGDQHPGLDMSLARAGRLRVTVNGPGASTDLNAGYRVTAADGTVVAEDPPAAYDGHQLSVLVRPGSWRVLVSGRATSSTNDVPLLSRWWGGGVSLATAPATDFSVGTDIDGGTLVLPGALRATTKPTIKGKASPGRTLRATKGSWNLMTGTTFVFRWKRGGKVVGKAASYAVRRADVGKRLSVAVTAKNGGLSTKITLKVRVP